MPTALVISPHADDAAAFCGATSVCEAAAFRQEMRNRRKVLIGQSHIPNTPN